MSCYSQEKNIVQTEYVTRTKLLAIHTTCSGFFFGLAAIIVEIPPNYSLKFKTVA